MRADFDDLAALADASLELRLLSVMHAWPGYYFAVQRVGGVVVGRVIVRFDDDPTIRLYAGNIAYEIDPAHRGHGYAARACGLLRPIARHHDADELWIVTAPDNVASCRTAERIGGEYVETLAVPEGLDVYALGLRWARRYRWRVAPVRAGA